MARDAVARPWHCFQALGIDLCTAGDALAKGAFANAVERAVHHQQSLALAAALAEQKFLGVGVGRAVGDVLRRFQIGLAAILCSAAYIVPQFPLAFLEPFSECV